MRITCAACEADALHVRGGRKRAVSGLDRQAASLRYRSGADCPDALPQRLLVNPDISSVGDPTETLADQRGGLGDAGGHVPGCFVVPGASAQDAVDRVEVVRVVEPGRDPE